MSPTLQGWLVVILNIFGNFSSPFLDTQGVATFTNRTIVPHENLPVFNKTSVTLLPSNITTTHLQNDMGLNPHPPKHILLKVFLSTIYFSLAIFGFTGNALVIYAILTDPGLMIKNHMSNMTVLSLAFTDIFSMSMVCFPASIAVYFDNYAFGKAYCYFWAFVNLSGILASIESLMVISIERFIAVKWPLHYPQYVTYNRLLIGQGHIWSQYSIASLLWCIIGVQFDYDSGVCDMHYELTGDSTSWTFYYGIWCFFYQLIRPSSIILYCNVQIIKISKGGGLAKKLKEAKTEMTEEEKANNKILKAMLICIVAFFIMSFPLGCTRIVRICHTVFPFSVAPIVSLVTTFFQFLSSCVNPLIYGLFRKDFRDAYANIWKNLKNKFANYW